MPREYSSSSRAAPGQSHTFGVFLTYVADDLRLSHTEVSFAYGVATLAAAFGLPYAGRHVDRRGARRVLTVVSLLLGAAAIGFGFVNGLVVLALGFAAVRFLGQGCLFLVASNVIAQWFERRRGFALSLVWLGFSASVALHPPFSQWLIETVGWREAWLWLGISSWALLLPVLWFIRNRPEDLGLRPDGAPPPEPHAETEEPSDPPLSRTDSRETGVEPDAELSPRARERRRIGRFFRRAANRSPTRDHRPHPEAGPSHLLVLDHRVRASPSSPFS